MDSTRVNFIGIVSISDEVEAVLVGGGGGIEVVKAVAAVIVVDIVVEVAALVEVVVEERLAATAAVVMIMTFIIVVVIIADVACISAAADLYTIIQISLKRFKPMLTLTYFTARSNLVPFV